MQSTLKELLPRWEVGFLISVFAVGFFITLLSVTVMISEASAGEAYCREYQTQVTIAGKSQNAYGTACRKSDGSWQIQRDNSGKTQLALTPATRAAASPPIIVLPSADTEVLYLDGELVVIEDWPIEGEVFLFEDPESHILVEETHDGVYIVEEPYGVVIVEDDNHDEVIVLD